MKSVSLTQLTCTPLSMVFSAYGKKITLGHNPFIKHPKLYYSFSSLLLLLSLAIHFALTISGISSELHSF